MIKTKEVFQRILNTKTKGSLQSNPETHKNKSFEILFEADGIIPFPQVIIRHLGEEIIYYGELLDDPKKFIYRVKIPENKLSVGKYTAQVEGCKKADYTLSNGEDWVKQFLDFEIAEKTAIKQTPEGIQKPTQRKSSSSKVKIYYGIHKHMHQPYYDATNANYWDGEKEEIFGTRMGPYKEFVSCAVHHYENGGLPHGGLSVSWSGTLIDQLNRCSDQGRCGGGYHNWAQQQKDTLSLKTVKENHRLSYSAFGYFHPLMPLIPARDIVKNIEMHRNAIHQAFGVQPSRILFPPETAFHVRMIPALNQAGIQAVIYDSVHRTRACKNYPYAGKDEGMLPPNPADQVNEEVHDWLQMQNVWAPSKISPSSLRPEYVGYKDPDGKEHKIIAIPAERFIGNEDARGGYGALQYGSVLGQLYDKMVETGTYDEKHPPFFLLHSDGDNYGGGTDSYYKNNTEQMVRWLQEDDRFELMSAEDYLEQFPPDPSNVIHIEPGSWAGADNGDPQFKKWFGMYDQPYSPDLNSWAVLTALQNLAHSMEDFSSNKALADEISFLMLTAETSCYWYWTGQDQWDFQVTNASNKAWHLAGSELENIKNNDKNGPTIFAPWVTPENPGGQTWGNNYLRDADKIGTIHTYIFDINGVADVNITLIQGDEKKVVPMKNNGPYPCHSGANITSEYYTVQLPEASGFWNYYITATDKKGNTSRGSLERIFVK